MHRATQDSSFLLLPRRVYCLQVNSRDSKYLLIDKIELETCKQMKLSEGRLEIREFVAILMDLTFNNSSPSKEWAFLIVLPPNNELGYRGRYIPLWMVEQRYCILLTDVLESHSCNIPMANLWLGVWHTYSSFSWRNKNKFKLRGQENFTKLTPSKPRSRGEWHFARLRRQLSSLNTLMTKTLAIPILRPSPCLWDTLSKPPPIARAYFNLCVRTIKNILTCEGLKAVTFQGN